MIEWEKLKESLRMDLSNTEEYESIISDIFEHKRFKKMGKFYQHGDITTLEHSLNVSFISYLICKKLNLDYVSAARGGLLHDFYLYDWHKPKFYKGLHGPLHPKVALRNAEKCFDLNARERDIIQKHMFPLTFKLPKYKESYVVTMVDKFVATGETFKIRNRGILVRIFSV